MSDAVLTEVDGGVAVITINRPEARNAVNGAVAKGMASALDELDARKDVSVLVLTGAGGTFSAGMDLKGFLTGDNPIAEGRGFGGIVERPPAKPIIAAVEGYALAGGFELALACDMIVASSESKFGLPEVKRGLVAGAGGLLRLPRRIPYHAAMELALSGEHYPASRLAELGLVNKLTSPGEALAEARELALRIAANAPLALAATKRVIVESADWDSSEQFAKQGEIINPVFVSKDAMEGAAAFAEKRPPEWSGE
ncbi:crotonase/enoyl-CoA hydratase family protein [Actinoallomurus bryophytorum]|uniref:Short chain enoyl-CoA hydratase n=1 Tax=Actinoallomurus bryophytorum TaxID=1490222 RepID=A0A543CH07_9ACTN|nr:crotonase/enoyl-CoA hydratase family protein [Actinoallomurus bryophytorum]TQL96384.1 short chain enoyl-CoA hydratase [Actinoallomurus bryophytorum]